MLSLYDLPLQHVEGERIREILIDSKAGTGKSVGGLSTLVEWGLEYPGSRILLYRATRTSLSEAHMVTLEDIVFPAWGIDPGPGKRSHRDKYVLPGGSEIILRGMDKPGKMYSTEYNVIYGGEGNQIAYDAYLKLFRMLRAKRGFPYRVSILECNPDTTFHYLVDRFGIEDNKPIVRKPGRIRWQARTKDNPAYYLPDGTPTEDGLEYEAMLDCIPPGPVRDSLVLGLWRAAQGQVYDNIDADKHHIEAEVFHRSGSWFLQEPGKDPVRLGWFMGGQDWGYTNPGVVQVWGHGDDGRWYMVEEVYQSKRDHAWWADEVDKLHRKYGIWRIVSDPEEAAGISMLNRRLIAADGKPLLIKANKTSAGVGRKEFMRVMHFRSMIGDDLIRWVKGARKHPADPDLIGKPASSFEEMPAIVYAPPPQSRQYEEVGGAPPTDQILRINNHGHDASTYPHWAVYEMDLTPPPHELAKPYHVSHAITEDPMFKKLMKARGL